MAGATKYRRHGLYGTPAYRAWQSMKARCGNPNHKNYDDYGGRGIVVCQRWLDSVEDFAADMGPHPGPGYTIERNDNEGDYEPGNCKWATRKEQSRNKRNNVLLTYKGETRLVIDWAKRFGLHPETIKIRIRSGMSVEAALETADFRDRPIEIKGRVQSIKAWAEEYGASYTMVYQRLAAGWEPEEALLVRPRGKVEGQLYTYKGESLTLMEWEKRLGIGRSTLLNRLNLGWTIEKAFETPVGGDLIEINGVAKSLPAWAAEYGIGYTTVLYRIRHGWDPAEALRAPVRGGNGNGGGN